MQPMRYKIIKTACVDMPEECLPSEFLLGKYPDYRLAKKALESFIEDQKDYMENRCSESYETVSETKNERSWSITVTNGETKTFIEIRIEGPSVNKNKRHTRGNQIVKFALLTIIMDIMEARSASGFVWLDEGFDRNTDRIHFTSGGHKCILAGVSCPNLEDAAIPLTVETEWDGRPNQKVDVTLNIRDIHINSLEKIACEVYNALWRPEEDNDFETVRKDTVAAFLDQYQN